MVNAIFSPATGLDSRSCEVFSIFTVESFETVIEHPRKLILDTRLPN